MVIFKSNQTVFSLETALFWLPLFHTESLPVTSFSAELVDWISLHQASFRWWKLHLKSPTLRVILSLILRLLELRVKGI